MTQPDTNMQAIANLVGVDKIVIEALRPNTSVAVLKACLGLKELGALWESRDIIEEHFGAELVKNISLAFTQK